MAPKDPVTGVGQEEALKALNTGDTAWMLISTAIVLIMTPGVAFFYGGSECLVPFGRGAAKLSHCMPCVCAILLAPTSSH